MQAICRGGVMPRQVKSPSLIECATTRLRWIVERQCPSGRERQTARAKKNTNDIVTMRVELPSRSSRRRRPSEGQ